MARTFKALAKYLVPAWISSGQGGLLLDATTSLIDDAIDRLFDGVRRRFPTRAATEDDADALDLLARDRGLRRGRSETAIHFAGRLRAWRGRTGHLTRGSAFALLQQVDAYWGGVNCATVDQHGQFRYRVAGVEAVGYDGDWDLSPTSTWAQFHIIIIPGTSVDLGPQDDFGGTIGIAGSTPGDWVAMRQLCSKPFRWVPAGMQANYLILSLGISLDAWDPAWIYWGKLDGTDLVPARPNNLRFINLRSELRDYAGQIDRWANAFVTDYYGTIDGDPTSFPATITMPDASTYAGDPTNFPATITIPDDGDIPA